MPVKAIIFDLGQTLIPFSFERLRPRWDVCREQAARLLVEAEIGELAPLQFQAAMCRVTRVVPAEFRAWWNSIFEPRWLVPEEWLRSLISTYRVGLLSNTNAIHFAHLERHFPLLSEFHFRILSHQVGAAKPAPAIYAAAESAAGCAPQELLYFDDIPAFVEAARRRGWRAELFEGAEKLAQQLGAQACLPAETAANTAQWFPVPRPAAAAPSRAKSSPSAPES
ncbi:MAG: HAD-IA family hydrolase [Terriglobales bacterium]